MPTTLNSDMRFSVFVSIDRHAGPARRRSRRRRRRRRRFIWAEAAGCSRRRSEAGEDGEEEAVAVSAYNLSQPACFCAVRLVGPDCLPVFSVKHRMKKKKSPVPSIMRALLTLAQYVGAQGRP